MLGCKVHRMAHKWLPILVRWHRIKSPFNSSSCQSTKSCQPIETILERKQVLPNSSRVQCHCAVISSFLLSFASLFRLSLFCLSYASLSFASLSPFILSKTFNFRKGCLPRWETTTNRADKLKVLEFHNKVCILFISFSFHFALVSLHF